MTRPDDFFFAGMVRGDTIFLHDDEMDVVYDAPEYQ